MRRLIYYTFFILTLFLISTEGLSQGWVITEADNSVTYVGDGWIKSLPGNMEEVPTTFMYKPGSNVIIMINEDEMTYARGSADDFCNAMKSLRDEMNKQMPPEQIKLMEELIAQEKAKPAPKVVIQKSSGESIGGYSTTKYSITVDGELYEEKWISSDGSLKGLIQTMNSVSTFSRKTAGCSVPDEAFLKNSPDFSEEYLDVERSGVELKSIRYEYGSAAPDTEVVSIEKENFSSDEFEVPEEYSEVSFDDIIMSMSGM